MSVVKQKLKNTNGEGCRQEITCLYTQHTHTHTHQTTLQTKAKQTEQHQIQYDGMYMYKKNKPNGKTKTTTKHLKIDQMHDKCPNNSKSTIQRKPVMTCINICHAFYSKST